MEQVAACPLWELVQGGGGGPGECSGHPTTFPPICIQGPPSGGLGDAGLHPPHRQPLTWPWGMAGEKAQLSACRPCP